MNEYQKFLGDIFANPRLGQRLMLGCGCDRVAFKISDEIAIKVAKVSMLPFDEKTGYFKIPDEAEDEVLNYYNSLYRDYGGDQTEQELHVYRYLTDEERKLFNPILDEGKFNDVPYIVSPMVKTGKELGHKNFIRMCQIMELDYNFELLEQVAITYDLDYEDMIFNSGNFGLNSEGKPVIIDFGLICM